MSQILSTYSPMSEAVFLLQTLAKGEGKEARLNDIKKRCRHDFSDAAMKKLDLVNRAEDALLDLLKDSLDEVRFYFKPQKEENGGILFNILFLYEYFFAVECDSLDQWIDDLRRMEPEEYYDILGCMIFYYDQNVNDTLDMNKCTNLEDVLRLVLDMDFSAKEKLLIQDIILNRDKHIECVRPLIEAALLVVEQFKKELKSYAKQFYKYWGKVLNGRDIYDYFNQEMGANIQTEKNPLGWKLCPAFFSPIFVRESICFDDETGEYEKEDSFSFGFLYGDDYSLADAFSLEFTVITEERALKLLKLLSDKSKFEILSLTGEKSAYGAELAEKLELTTATVSYHTSELNMAGLLNVEKRGNKIYYSRNQKTVDSLLEYIKNRI